MICSIVYRVVLFLFSNHGLEGRDCCCRVREGSGKVQTEYRAVEHESLHALDVQHATGLQPHTPPCDSRATVTACFYYIHMYLQKAKVRLESYKVLLPNLCVLHGLNKCFPGGRLATLALDPFGEAGLHCCLLIQGIAPEACFNCGCVKPHPFQNCPPLGCSYSADMLSEEHEVVWTICRDIKKYSTRSYSILNSSKVT